MEELSQSTENNQPETEATQTDADVTKDKSVQQEDKPFECSICSKRFDYKQTLRRHVRIHTGEKPFVCPKCGKSFVDKQEMKRHQSTRACVDLKQHYKECHPAEQNQEETATQIDISKYRRILEEKKPFGCNDCGKRFSYKHSLKQHAVIHTGERPFKCPDCGRTFNKRGNLKVHLLRAHGRELKNEARALKVQTDLSKHRIIYNEGKRFGCAVCGQRFMKGFYLTRHIRTHTGEKPFKCPDCGRCFGEKGNMLMHHAAHNGEKRFSCEFCGKLFFLKKNLNEHIRIHTGQKPFQCPDCGRRFSRRIHCERHRIAQHYKWEDQTGLRSGNAEEFARNENDSAVQ